jgi:hypothetical protein
MFDLFNAPLLTDAGAKSYADFGAAALNTDAAKSFASSFKVVAWSAAIVAVGWVTIKVFHEARRSSTT